MNNPFDLCTSVDLRQFLCSKSQQSNETCKSSQLLLEIEPDGVDAYLNFDFAAPSTSSCILTQVFSVVSICSNRITVSAPVNTQVYQGGPRVAIRTNLTSHFDTMGTMEFSQSFGVGLGKLAPSDVAPLPRVLNTFTASCSITCLTAHPVMPVLCVGMADDTVQFIVPDNSPV